MVTIKEIAEKTGVSAATVCCVLNEARKVRPETKPDESGRTSEIPARLAIRQTTGPVRSAI